MEWAYKIFDYSDCNLYKYSKMNHLMLKNFDKKLEKLRKFLGRQKSVKFAYLFGSYARRKAGTLSDIDIAIYLESQKMHEKELFLINAISDILGTDEFDIVILNNLDTVFCFNVIKEGIPLKSSPDMKVFEFRVMHRFLDEQYHENLMADIALERISKMGLL